jgi:hypothetical protein
MFFERVDLLNQVDQLLAFAFADIEKTNADLVAVVDGLRYAGEEKRQSVQVKFDLGAMVHPDGKAIFSAELAPVQTQVQDAAAQPDPGIEQVQNGDAIHREPGFLAPFGSFRWRRASILFWSHPYLIGHRPDKVQWPSDNSQGWVGAGCGASRPWSRS